jgi:hypothetical protein
MELRTSAVYMCVCTKERGRSHEYFNTRWSGSCLRLEADCSRIEAHARYRWVNPLWRYETGVRVFCAAGRIDISNAQRNSPTRTNFAITNTQLSKLYRGNCARFWIIPIFLSSVFTSFLYLFVFYQLTSFFLSTHTHSFISCFISFIFLYFSTLLRPLGTACSVSWHQDFLKQKAIE